MGKIIFRLLTRKRAINKMKIRPAATGISRNTINSSLVFFLATLYIIELNGTQSATIKNPEKIEII